jgi:hypothetical protein
MLGMFKLCDLFRNHKWCRERGIALFSLQHNLLGVFSDDSVVKFP